jgi:hypothetical protein
MDRKQFIRNLSLACVALSVPKVFQINKPAIQEYIGSRGILWHIQHQPTINYPFSIGKFTIADFNEMARAYRDSK